MSPATANKEVCSQLSEAQQAALEEADEMCQQFAANPTTPVIWEHLISLVKQVIYVSKAMSSCSFAGIWFT
jgi:hypothetical protein